jgi:hypothetical protein
MTLRTIWIYAAIAALLMPNAAVAQKVESFNFWEPGDKTTYNWVANNKAQQVQETWISSTGEEVVGTQKFGDKEIPIVVSKSSLLQLKRMCNINGQACAFSPGRKMFELPLEKGKQWTGTYALEGETFTAQISEDARVEKYEKVRVPAGEFDAFKISITSRVKGTTSKGDAFNIRSDEIHWIAFIAGKPVWVKITASNSSGDKASRELVSTTFK